MVHIDYYFTVLSPFCYLAGDGLEKIAAKHGATITYKPADIGKIFAETGGLPLPQRPIQRREYRMQELARIPKMVGLPLNREPKHWPTDPALAMTSIVAAINHGGGDVGKLAHALMRACWAEEKDVAEADVVSAALGEAGFPASLDMSGAGDVIAKNTDDALAAGVFGAPFYIVGEERFWGQDRLSYLDAHLADMN